MIRIRLLVVPSLVLVGIYFWSRLFEPLGWLSFLAIPPALWMALDSKRLGVQNFDTGLNHRPTVLFLIGLSFPVVVIPWYLTVRDLIRSGRAVRRVAPAGPAA